MIGIEKYMGKEMLLETIKFNTRFLDFGMGGEKLDMENEQQFLELNNLLSEWELRHYDSNYEIEHANSLLESFHLV